MTEAIPREPDSFPATPFALISYRHDSKEHEARVAELVSALRSAGIRVAFDQDHAFHGAPKEGWILWMQHAVERAAAVIVVWTAGYREAWDKGKVDVGRGVQWESGAMRARFYDGDDRRRLISIVFSHDERHIVPAFLRNDFAVEHDPEQRSRIIARCRGWMTEKEAGAVQSVAESTTTVLDPAGASGGGTEPIDWSRRQRIAVVLGAVLLATGALLVSRKYLQGESGKPDNPRAASGTTGISSAIAATHSATDSGTNPRTPSARMIRIGGGQFTMGSTNQEIVAARALCTPPVCMPEFLRRETPARDVVISAFRIDAREVNAREFAGWLNAQADLVPAPNGPVRQNGNVVAHVGHKWGLQRRGDRYEPASGLADAPVVMVSWVGAKRYCEARGARLPTEAEWELAARGSNRRQYPWGDRAPDCDQVVFGRDTGGACAERVAGPRPSAEASGDRTPDGIDGLGGNVREWVADPFTETYTPCAGPCSDPGRGRGPNDDRVAHVVRGGNFWEPLASCRAARRSHEEAQGVDAGIGFRCATSAADPEEPQ
jgi:formylglycine-generating enzyme required for sulfatase activity